jgi:Uma2 family endonuclease
VEDENMMTVLRTSDQTVVLKGIRWETYEHLLADHQESCGTRLSFDYGTLEIMAPSSEHERLKETITLLFQLLASEMGIDVLATGSTTFRRQDLLKGFEPDASFYIKHAEAVRSQEKIDLSVCPPPDLVIEIEITNSVMEKLSIFSQPQEFLRCGSIGMTISRYSDSNRIGIARMQRVRSSAELPIAS